MWVRLEPTVTEQQTRPWCAGLPPPEHIAAPRQMDDVVPCSTTTMSYHPGIQENRHHLKQKAAICLLDIMMPVLRIYLKHIVVWINYCLGPFMVYSCERCKNVHLFQKYILSYGQEEVKFILWRKFQCDELQHTGGVEVSHTACKIRHFTCVSMWFLWAHQQTFSLAWWVN